MPRAPKQWNLAARAGRWSSQHRKAAVMGWLAFVVAAALIGVAMGTRSMATSDYAADKVPPVLAAVDALERSHPGFVIEEFGTASGDRALNETIAADLQRAGYLSLPVTLAILLLAFGGLVAAGIPVLLALSGVLGTFGLVALVSHVVPEGSPTASVIFMIGMAVGVDYSLFYLRREREERAAGRAPLAALRVAAATSGQAVLVSGTTVMIAMAGMLFTGAKVFTSIGVGTMLVVLVAMVGSVTVLPAALATLGLRVDQGKLPFMGRGSRMGGEGPLWGKILTPVLARPLASAVTTALLLVLLALPALRLHTQLLGFTSLPTDTPIVQTYHTIRSHIAVVFGFVIGLAFLLLLVTFRSIVIPLKAVVLNLLSLGPAYGVLVAVFQHGWGASLIGASATGAITSWLPLFLFVILFGLSMDHHVFILSRVKELVDQGMPTRAAVQQGIRTTAGTVASAAIVMVAVFAIFITGHTPDLKQMGLDLAVAVLLDATVIRGILLPATMELFGEWNWYLPSWLERLIGTRPPGEAARA
jgi:uncharacterized membrane protein YdfJ with MMPL/SSD domain